MEINWGNAILLMTPDDIAIRIPVYGRVYGTRLADYCPHLALARTCLANYCPYLALAVLESCLVLQVLRC